MEDILAIPELDDLIKHFEELVENDELMEDLYYFQGNEMTTFTKPIKEIAAGWYQNSKGLLYHYDGVVWDDVPLDNLKELEYLG
jgi:hypothetical protein